jgi:hypothetical protein
VGIGADEGEGGAMHVAWGQGNVGCRCAADATGAISMIMPDWDKMSHYAEWIRSRPLFI